MRYKVPLCNKCCNHVATGINIKNKYISTPKIFLYTHRKLHDGSYPIVLQIIKDRKRKLISLGHSATPAQWDIENNQPTKKHPNHKDLVLMIQKKLYQANKTIMELDEADKPYTIEDIIVKLKSSKSSNSVFKYSEDFIKKLEKTGKTGNATIYTTLNVFKICRNDKDLTFNQFSYRVVKDFEESQLEKKIKINTISIYLRTLRAIHNYAIKDKVAQQSLYPFKDFRVVYWT